ncbi:MAG: hypothetical protein J7L43_01610 [Candidatus Aenigmarchaeota archaeon]|nr:hypothetical protein [Candidatus Aenigmarchaeota archaeon]
MYSPNIDNLKIDLINELKLEERIKILKEVGKPLSNVKEEIKASIRA